MGKNIHPTKIYGRVLELRLFVLLLWLSIMLLNCFSFLHFSLSSWFNVGSVIATWMTPSSSGEFDCWGSYKFGFPRSNGRRVLPEAAKGTWVFWTVGATKFLLKQQNSAVTKFVVESRWEGSHESNETCNPCSDFLHIFLANWSTSCNSNSPAKYLSWWLLFGTISPFPCSKSCTVDNGASRCITWGKNPWTIWNYAGCQTEGFPHEDQDGTGTCLCSLHRFRSQALGGRGLWSLVAKI